MRVFINYKQKIDPDHSFAIALEKGLRAEGHHVFRDETNIVPSEEWPARLEKEIRSCDAMISLVSNASLRSKWVLNEIDLANRLSKRIVPVLIGEIEESLRFQALNPRFLSTQWLTATGDHEEDCNAIADVLREPRHECYRDLLNAKLKAYGVNDSCELLEALFSVLYHSHWPAIALNQAQIYDPHDRFNGEKSCSLAESLRNYTEIEANLKKQNSSNYRKKGDEDRSKLLAWQGQRLRCLSEILDTLIAVWTRSGHAKVEGLKDGENWIFDATDGEGAFGLANAKSVLFGRLPEPVPIDQIVRIYKVDGPAEVPLEGTEVTPVE